MDDPKVIAAWVAAFASVVAAFVAWFRAIEVENVRGGLAKELEQVRGALQSAQAREQHAAKRALDFEFELFKLACASISEAGRALDESRRALVALAKAESKTNPPADVEAIKERSFHAFAGVRTSGHFLPPDLDDSYEAAALALQAHGLSIVDARRLTSPEERLEMTDPKAKGVIDTAGQFIKVARSWKRTQWERFGAELAPGNPGASATAVDPKTEESDS